MEAPRFDGLTRALAQGVSRRSVLKGLASGLGLAGVRRGAVAAWGAPGTPCDSARDCDSFHCVDGVCCDTPCTGQCEACDVAGSEGSCLPVSGAPHGNRAACPGSGPCAATCDGQTTDSCADFPGSETTCGESTCVDGWQTTSACGGNGTCDPTTTSCGLFVCNADGTACLARCAGDADCVGRAHCAEGACRGDKGLGEACADAAECQHGFCVDGVCCNAACDDPCAACNVAGSEGFCTVAVDGGTICGAECCAEGEVCDATTETCRASGCTASAECGDNRVCCDGACCDPGQACVEGACSETCDTASDCPEPFDPCQASPACVNGECTFSVFVDGSSCGENRLCCDRTCCDAGDACNDGACSAICDLARQCPEPFDPCQASPACVGGDCTFSVFTDGTECDTNRVCCDGQCVEACP